MEADSVGKKSRRRGRSAEDYVNFTFDLLRFACAGQFRRRSGGHACKHKQRPTDSSPFYIEMQLWTSHVFTVHNFMTAPTNDRAIVQSSSCHATPLATI